MPQLDRDLAPAHPDRFFIGGKWTVPEGDRSFSLVAPYDGEAYLSVAEAQEADVNRAVAAARTAFDEGPWPQMAASERAVFLGAIAKALPSRSAAFGRAWTDETGVISGIAQYNAAGGAGTFAQYAGLASSFPWVEKHKPATGGGVGLLLREPVGVVAAIVPWNAPLSLLSMKLAPALLSGCTVILKASPEAPLDALLFAEICETAGLPAGVVNVITADRAVSEYLVRHPDVDKVSFTGSSAAGKRIASICGERIARCTLELGGKSAALILDDYDLAEAAQSITRSTLLLNGQVCAALTRVIVPRRRHDELVDAIAEAMKTVSVGDPRDPSTQLGPLAVERQRDRVEGYIAAGRKDGARLVHGGSRPAGLNRGWYVEPTLFANVDNRSTIAQEEIFGPVLSVIAAEGEDDAIRIANDTVYGLNNSVFTNDVDAAYRVSRRLRSGTVSQSGFRTAMDISFGGFKQSGLGREGGREGLYPYLEAKTVLLASMPSAL